LEIYPNSGVLPVPSGRNSEQGSVFFVLAVLGTVVMAAALFFAFSGSGGEDPLTEGAAPTQQVVTDGGQQHLSVQKLPEDKPEAVPKWMVFLVTAFVLLQIFSLMIAERMARDSMLSPQVIRKIGFLCETPMYFGLLGSLLGICVTQWTTGSLAAPLAYLTTITGIILHLYGKFSILLSIPDAQHGLSGD
jgi:hypothetical protein